MIYENSKKPYSEELFHSPTSDYRATPFWAWNGKLDKDELLWQIDEFLKMGYGGYHCHVRAGMDTTYLDDAFFDLIDACIKRGEQNNMLTYLYDEDRWPSGAAGGYVTKHKEYRQRHLHFYTEKSKDEDDVFLAAYDISFDDNGYIKEYSRIGVDDEAAHHKRYAYIFTEKPGNGWFNNQCYADLLSKTAIRKFIDVTHEQYKRRFADKFGSSVVSIFTDEPQVAWSIYPKNSDDMTAFEIPWTDELTSFYLGKYGEDILDSLPEVFYDLPDKYSRTRYRYRETVMEMFASSFADQIGEWGRENNLPLTGHMMNEHSLIAQTRAVGDNMRCLRNFGIPGIDMLCNFHEFLTAKQCQSVKDQGGKNAMLCELDGVTNWNFDMRHHKNHGDWMAALGVTLRVPHLALYTMKGQAKRDYPASINYQASYSKYYHILEDYFARVATAMTRGKRNVRLAVVHPVRTEWLKLGDERHYYDDMVEFDQKWFLPLVEKMLKNQQDFDFLSESNLPCQVDLGGITNTLKVGACEYDAVLVPAAEVLTSTTVQILEKFAKMGGKVLFAGGCPEYVDGEKSDKVRDLYSRSITVEKNIDKVIEAIDLLGVRDVEIKSNGRRSDKYVYQLRTDGADKWLFIAQANTPDYEGLDEDAADKIAVMIDGEYYPTVYDAFNDYIFAPEYEHKDGKTVVYYNMYNFDSLLLRFTNNKLTDKRQIQNRECSFKLFDNTAKFTLSEPNVLLLDKAEFKLDDGEWQDECEILRLDNICRKKLGWVSRDAGSPQPWVINDETPTNLLTLKYTFDSRIDYDGAYLALEEAASMKIVMNGQEVKPVADGWYVDKCIGKLPLCNIRKGKNEIIIYMPYFVKANPEAMYLLGDFGVYKDENGRPYIDDLPNTLRFGDYAAQGLMFYGGDVRYHFDIDVSGDCVDVKVPSYRGALVNIYIDGEYKGYIINSPYSLHIDGVKAGKHHLEIENVGTRVNTFGQLHCRIPDKEKGGLGYWWGPNSWMTTGDEWTEDYDTWIEGILTPPAISK